MPVGNATEIIRFSAFEVDLRAGELRKNGAKIKLQQQPFQILALMLQCPGQIVTREDLRRELWPQDTFVDFDHSLNAAIARLRDALGESADRPVFVETLARRGYRFNCPLLAPAPSPDAAPDGTSPDTTSLKPTRAPISRAFPVARIAAAAILGASLLAAGALTWARFSSRYFPEAPPHIQSIAVLPLENLSHEADQDYFSDGMTSAIISSVSTVRPLRVISRTSTARYKGTRKSLPEIAKELHVDAVIEGSVLRAGDRVRIDVELIEAATDKQLWSESYERPLGDVLKLHSELAQAIADKVQIRLAPQQTAKLQAAQAINKDAYESYLRGRYYSVLMQSYSQNLIAQQYYQKAVQQDPVFALAYAGLGDSYLVSGSFRRLSPRTAGRHGREYLDKALQLDPSLTEAHASLGYWNWRYEWNWAQADAEFRRAIEGNPSNLDAHESYAWFLGWSGRRDEASAEIALMRKLDPAFPLRCNDEAGLHYHSREYEAMKQAGLKGTELNSADWVDHYFVGVANFALGETGNALNEFQKASDLSDGDLDPLAALAFTHASLGHRSAALKILEGMQHPVTGQYVSPYMLAVIWAGLGDKTRAFQLLEKSYAEKSTDLVYFIKADFRLDSLRPDPRFQDLLRRVAPPGIAR